MSSFRHPGTVLTDHVLEVPLDHDAPAGETISLFARSVVATDGGDKPWLVFLQGGPGSPSPRPIGRDSWLDRALRDYRVLLLDQRGTGRSARVSRHSVLRRGGPAEQAEYLSHFRADSIVRDAELLRRHLLGDAPWSVLGQSFGGFCAVAYLSHAPSGLREVLITGGLPGLTATAEDVYRATYPRVAAKNAAHYARYPHDVAAVRAITEHLLTHDVRLADGAPLTAASFQSLGLALGSSTGSHELHYLTEDAFESPGVLSDAFLAQVHHRLSLASTPLYAVLHEACYAQGAGATAWAAHRLRAEHPAFDAAAALAGDAPVLFTGEMIYPWQFETDPALAPLREAAELLAARPSWPALYDPAALAANTVPVAAAVYHDDMYVDRELSLRTAEAIKDARVWVTNEHEHDGLRVSSGAVLDRLIAMARGNA
ncbi:alpha/beta fold hydrolase [Dactylosporangium sp. NPDC048998]|uniref:alpha/beta fold hydrolase n=1 Tax=Dactylosporangium sp. NPDC048998 TaxID=3363976 RepID=UPI003719833C